MLAATAMISRDLNRGHEGYGGERSIVGRERGVKVKGHRERTRGLVHFWYLKSMRTVSNKISLFISTHYS